MNSSHRVRVLGRELQLRSTAAAETVQEVEAFVNERLKEVAASSNTSDTQIIAILALMNIAESYLALVRENTESSNEGSRRISRILREVETNLD